jgi:hypothetical protein
MYIAVTYQQLEEPAVMPSRVEGNIRRKESVMRIVD